MLEKHRTTLFKLLVTAIFVAGSSGLPSSVARAQLETVLSERSNVTSPGVTFQPPTDGTLDDSAGGATRPVALKCRQDPASAVPLSAVLPAQQVGLTVKARPMFFAYVPETSAGRAYFSLKDESGREVYGAMLPLRDVPGIVQVQLPADGPPLEVDRTYRWQLGILCQPAQTDMPWIEGRVRRVSPDSSEIERPQHFDRLSAVEQAAWYGEAGFWYDTLAVLADEYVARPDDPTLSQTWHDLLVSAGLGELARQPLVRF
ncbi:MAG: DUF928 domain-containing protein [Cyanobacteria bacterium SID2]|nr:DUF928 domain-containing protein [Cyanobacteria bacterium SID2]MBP0005452.1 DUF928 domain-containing protein [Cyanobacteria bacterium SBC]